MKQFAIISSLFFCILFIFDSSFRNELLLGITDGFFESDRVEQVEASCKCKYKEKRIPLSREEKFLMFIPGVRAVTSEQIESEETCDIKLTNKLDYSIKDVIVKIYAPVDNYSPVKIVNIRKDYLTPQETVRQSLFLSTQNFFGNIDRKTVTCKVIYINRN